MSYRTLVVAPTTDLEHSSDEVMAVVNALGARLLQGKRATIQGLLDIMDQGWDIVWFCTHGDEQGVYLSDGVVKASELTTLIRSASVQLTVLNTCSSKMVALAIHDELGGDLVCTVKAVPDREAFVTGTVFARQIARGLSFFDAYEAAKPGQNSTYAYIGEKRSAVPPSIDKGRFGYGDSPQMPDAATLIRFIQACDDLEKIVNGAPRLGLSGIKDAIPTLSVRVSELSGVASDLKNQMQEMREDQAEIRKKQSDRNLVVTSMGIAIFLLIITVAVLSLKLGGVL